MARKWFLTIILALTLTTLACGINFQVQVKTGPMVTDQINVPLSDGVSEYDITLSFGAGTLNLNPGAQGALVSGTATYNVADFKPKTTISGSVVKVEQGNLNIGGIPTFSKGIKNEWNLLLGTTPMRLHISAGAYSGNYELGGLALKSLSISDGAADSNLTFSQPNLVDMDKFDYKTGASDVNLKGLAYANFTELSFRGGAGNYKLDFSGDMRHDAAATIESGLSSVTIVVPAGVNAQVKFEGGLTDVKVGGGWVKQGDTYVQSGSGPLLNITVKMGAGSLTIRNP